MLTCAEAQGLHVVERVRRCPVGEPNGSDVAADAKRAADTVGNGGVGSADQVGLALVARALAVRVGEVDVVELVDLDDRLGRLRLRRVVGAGEGDLGLGSSFGVSLRAHRSLVDQLCLLRVGQSCLHAGLDPDSGRSGCRTGRLGVAVERAGGALQRCLDLRLHLGLGRDVDIDQKAAGVAHLDDLGVHPVNLAAHAVAARLDQAHLADIASTPRDVVNVLVQTQTCIPLQDGRTLDGPLEAADDPPVHAGVADHTAGHGHDNGLAASLLGDALRLQRALLVAHLDVRRLGDSTLAHLDVVVGVPPKQLSGAVDDSIRLLDHTGGSRAVAVADALDCDGGVRVRGGRHERGEPEPERETADQGRHTPGQGVDEHLHDSLLREFDAAPCGLLSRLLRQGTTFRRQVFIGRMSCP